MLVVCNKISDIKPALAKHDAPAAIILVALVGRVIAPRVDFSPPLVKPMAHKPVRGHANFCYIAAKTSARLGVASDQLASVDHPLLSTLTLAQPVAHRQAVVLHDSPAAKPRPGVVFSSHTPKIAFIKRGRNAGGRNVH
jgi:hypothetical protein